MILGQKSDFFSSKTGKPLLFQIFKSFITNDIKSIQGLDRVMTIDTLMLRDINIAINVVLNPIFFKQHCRSLCSETIHLLMDELLREYSIKIKREKKIIDGINKLLSYGYTRNELIRLSKLSTTKDTATPIYSTITLSKDDIMIFNNNVDIVKAAIVSLNAHQLEPLIMSLKKINVFYP